MVTDRNKKLFSILLLFMLLSGVLSRRHRLRLENDDREQIIISTFGFLTNGTLAVNLSNFSYQLGGKSPPDDVMFGFTLYKSRNNELSSFMEKMPGSCPLNSLSKDKDQMDQVQTVMFQFDPSQKKLFIKRKGKEMKNLVISPDSRADFYSKKHLHLVNRRAVDSEPYLQGLRDESLFGAGRVLAVQNTVPDKTDTHQDKINTHEDKPDIVDELDINVETVGNMQIYSVYFLVWIKNSEEEGMYNLFFHDCLNYKEGNQTVVNFSVEIVEDNNGNYLTAGEMPLPALHFTFSVVFFIMGVAWLSVLCWSKETVNKIHYLMLAVVAVKSQACIFDGMNMYFIQKTGVHEGAWAILWYIVNLTRGALMFVTILLVGAGWGFTKHMLICRKKMLFIIFISLLVLDSIVWVIVEESEKGNQSYITWKEIAILVDLLCCGAIFFPIVWSIHYLKKASTMEQAGNNLQKLKLFRHFYLLVVCYIYFTRIVIYLLKLTLPFTFEWLTDLFMELAMMVFFIVTAIKFRPASVNPYLQVPMDSNDDETEMEEVLTKTGATDVVVKVNQKDQGWQPDQTNGEKSRM